MKFIVPFGTLNYDGDNRDSALSVRNKVEYLIRKIESIGIDVEIISCTNSINKLWFSPKRVEKFNNSTLINNPLICFPTKIGYIMQRVFKYLWLLNYLLLYTNKNEEILVYHQYNPVIKLANKFKKYNIILEVEEIYGNLTGNETKRDRELRDIKLASKYLVASENINKLIDNKNKPYCVFNGRYDVIEKKEKVIQDDKIHIVYAGSICYNLVAFSAIKIAEYLPSNYIVHILGWGKETDIMKLNYEITNINKKSDCKVEYNGLLHGEELNNFMQNCHIGISPQRTEELFANSCFPSKLALYLSNGLRVVASYSKSVEESPFGKTLNFASGSEPQEFAKCICEINLDDKYDSMTLIKELDRCFEQKLAEFMRS